MGSAGLGRFGRGRARSLRGGRGRGCRIRRDNVDLHRGRIDGGGDVLARELGFALGGKKHRVMARAEGYAMARNPGCMPFVVSEKKLTAPTAPEAR